MDNDRALLEAAARAAGVPLDLTIRPDGKPLFCKERGLAIDEVPGWWGPHTSDADAFRLAVKLSLFWAPDFMHNLALERFAHQDKDDCHAYRRAIVRTAAALAPPPHAWMEEDN